MFLAVSGKLNIFIKHFFPKECQFQNMGGEQGLQQTTNILNMKPSVKEGGLLYY